MRGHVGEGIRVNTRAVQCVRHFTPQPVQYAAERACVVDKEVEAKPLWLSHRTRN